MLFEFLDLKERVNKRAREVVQVLRKANHYAFGPVRFVSMQPAIVSSSQNWVELQIGLDMHNRDLTLVLPVGLFEAGTSVDLVQWAAQANADMNDHSKKVEAEIQLLRELQTKYPNVAEEV